MCKIRKNTFIRAIYRNITVLLHFIVMNNCKNHILHMANNILFGGNKNGEFIVEKY